MTGVFVKPLKWTKQAPPAYDNERGGWWAAGHGGWYHVERDGLLWMASNPFVWEQHADQKIAKAAAQSDYDARILSAIDTTAIDADLAALRSQVSALTDERDRLREAAEHGLSFAESWVENNGGIDGCEIQDRLGLELIRAALSPKPEGE